MLQRYSFLLLISLVFMATRPLSAEVYHWVDENGQVHFDDQPKGQATKQFKSYSTPSATHTDPQQRMERTRKLLNAYQIERQQEREQNARQKEEEEKRRKNCIRARDRLRQYQEYGSIYRLDDAGNRVYMSDQERVSAIQRSRESVAKWCR